MKDQVALTKKEMGIYCATIVNIFLCWSPSNLMAYLSPFIFAGIVGVWSTQVKMFTRLILTALVWILIVFFYLLFNKDFQILNAALWIFTWAGIIIVILFPYDQEISYNKLQDKLHPFLWMVVLVEATLGIIQGLYGFVKNRSFDLSTGDFVEGTIHPALESELSLSNPMFSTNMALLLLLLLYDLISHFTYKKAIVYLLGIISFVMASTGHVIIAFTISIFLVFLSIAILSARSADIRPLLNILVVASVNIVTIFVLLSATQPNNLRLISNWLSASDTPRTRLINVLVRTIPTESWLAPLIGFGPGQLASRAGLISTGLYFGSNWASRPAESATTVQRRFLIPLKRWQMYNPSFGRSSNAAPHSSWLALYSEFGIAGIACIIICLLATIRTLLKFIRISYLETSIVLSSIVLLILIGWQELYWEVPQAWFSNFVILKIVYFKMKQRSNQQ